MEPDIFFLLVAIGTLAGAIEATAGGSGLIALPTLLILGFTPVQAMTTSKLQYAFGAVVSIFRFNRAGFIAWKKILPMIIASAAAGGLGALLLLNTNMRILNAIIPFLLIASALYFLFSPRLGSDNNAKARLSLPVFIFGPVALIGFYDGFFGVGSASFFVLAMIWGLGLSVRHATATTKIVDFSCSMAALVMLLNSPNNHVPWLPGIALGVGQMAGAWIGSGLVIRHGVRYVRPVLVLVSFGFSIKLLWDYFSI